MKHKGALKRKIILVTGGAGFIGSNLCEHLLDSGAYVRCLDNFSTGYRRNVETFLADKRFQLIEGDIRDINVCQDAANKVDIILHQAALGSVPRSIADPLSSNEVNVNGFLNMLIAARDQGVKRFIFAASSSTYGDSKELPKVEDIIGNPLSPYAVTKYVNELYADIFKRTYDVDYIGLRYFNVFGPRQDPNGAYAAVVPKFIKQIIDCRSPVINGDGNHSRDFTYISNVIQMNVLAILTNDIKSINQIYNTAVGERTSIDDLFFKLKDALIRNDKMISKVMPIYGPERKGDVPHSLASIEKAKKLLDYNPTHDLQKGIEESIEWYIENL